MWAVKRGFQPGKARVNLEAGGDEAHHVQFVTIHLGSAARSISGVVVDAAGRAVSGARVFVTNPTVYGMMEDGFATIEGYLSGGNDVAGIPRVRLQAAS